MVGHGRSMRAATIAAGVAFGRGAAAARETTQRAGVVDVDAVQHRYIGRIANVRGIRP